MNLFDLVIIYTMGFCLIRGPFRGFYKELASIIGMFAGFFAGIMLYPGIAEFLSSWIPNTGQLKILSFLLVFLLVYNIISLLGVIIHYILDLNISKLVDRICGIGFGAVKGLIMVSILLIIVTVFLPKGAPFIQGSLFSMRLTRVAGGIVKIAPVKIRQTFTVKIDDYREKSTLKH